MTTRRNLAHSVRDRLKALATDQGRDFELVLTRFAIERLIYRLSLTTHARRFVLKGAALVASWFDMPHRPTRDVDFLAFGPNTAQAMVEVLTLACSQALPDGLVYDLSTLRTTPIREEIEYGGVRLVLVALLDRARIPLTIDVGFGDAVVPPDEDITLPVLLDFPAPRIRAYARETVIAEKAHAIVELGRANTRMKDFYDIWFISEAFEFDHERLEAAITATFARRGTAVPSTPPDGLSDDFARDAAKQRQWAAFTKPLSPDTPGLPEVVTAVRAFLAPQFERLARQGR